MSGVFPVTVLKTADGLETHVVPIEYYFKLNQQCIDLKSQVRDYEHKISKVEAERADTLIKLKAETDRADANALQIREANDRAKVFEATITELKNELDKSRKDRDELVSRLDAMTTKHNLEI